MKMMKRIENGLGGHDRAEEEELGREVVEQRADHEEKAHILKDSLPPTTLDR